MNLSEELYDHLNAVCKNKELRSMIEDFFVDFSKKYKGVYFTEQDFEKFKVQGREIKQDVVVDLLSRRDKISAEELFAYLFKNNVDKINYYYTSIGVDKNMTGYIEPSTKTIKIRQVSKHIKTESKPILLEISEDDNLSTRELRRLINAAKKSTPKPTKEQKRQARYDFIRHTLYHELSHVFELKTFENRKYIKYNMSEAVLVRQNERDYITCQTRNLTKDAVIKGMEYLTQMSKRKTIPTTEAFLNEYKMIGSNYISEILNEIHASRIDNSLDIQNYIVDSSTGTNTFVKTYMPGNCGYNMHYDIAMLLQEATNERDSKNLRFNSESIIEKINSLDISEKFLAETKSSIIDAFRQSCSEDVTPFLEDFEKGLQDCDIYSTISISMGVFENFLAQVMESSGGYEEEVRNINNFKSVIQDLFVEGIKNDCIKQLNDNNIKKDDKFFEQLNSKLEIIDSVLSYPYGYFDDQNEIEDIENLDLVTDDLLLVPVKNFAKYYPDCKHIKSFNDLLNETQKYIDNHPETKDFLPDFLRYQKDLQETFTLNMQGKKFEDENLEVEHFEEKQDENYSTKEESPTHKTYKVYKGKDKDKDK